MLETINNYNYKSFKNYTGPSIDKFKKKNIFFGYNGKGKTALSKGIINEFLKDSENTDANYRFYNKDYIKNNLLLENNNGLKGIVATFGAKDVDVEKEILEKEKEIKDTLTITKDINDAEDKINNEISNIFNSKKGNSSIKKKVANNIEELIEAYKKDLQHALKLVTKDELTNFKDASEYEKDLLALQTLKITDVNVINEEEINSIYDIMSTEYNAEEIPSTKIIEWLKEGLEIHKKENSVYCKFCGGNLNMKEIEEKTQKYLEDRKQQDLQKLEFFIDKLKNIINTKEAILYNGQIVSNMVGDSVDDIYDIVIENIDKLENYVDISDLKIKNMTNTYQFDKETIIDIMTNISNAFANINNEKNNKILTLNSKIEKSNILIKGAIALEISNNSLIKTLITEKEEKTKILHETEKNNQKLLIQISKLKNSKSTTSDFANYINELLLQLGIDFYLDIVEKNYVIKHRNDNIPLLLDDISEGENNLLALLFFYYELFNDDKQKQFKDEIKTIIVDDPISSVDDVNKMYILELVKKIVDLECPQIFIFTHVWEDFCNICYGKKDSDKEGKETPYRFYEIKKNENGSYLVKTKTKETPYKHDFKEIYEFSKKTNTDDLTDCEIYHYPNIMRKILEQFMSFKVSNSSPTSDNINNVKIALCKDVNQVSNNDNIQIPVLLDVCNILSHKSARNPEQILKSAQYLMRKIETVDINHFTNMTN